MVRGFSQTLANGAGVELFVDLAVSGCAGLLYDEDFKMAPPSASFIDPSVHAWSLVVVPFLLHVYVCVVYMLGMSECSGWCWCCCRLFVGSWTAGEQAATNGGRERAVTYGADATPM